MSRMWEIREEHDSKFGPRYGYKDSEYTGYRGMSGRRDSSFDEGYDCGYEDGYRAAMKEAKRAYDK